MDWQLDAAETRVLGALLEKEITTPDYYPLSTNALVNACNQKSNREPVVAYDDGTVEEALQNLRDKGLAMRVTGDGRVAKHEQRFTEKFNLGRREAALLCVLMLRGPQTVGELRGRSERLYTFDDLESVEATLMRLAEMEFVKKLPRRPGFEFDFDAVIDACARHHTALEINAAPERLDLDDVLARRAHQRGACLCINTDAHVTAWLDNLKWGVVQARRAWLGAADVINAWPTDRLLAWLKG